MNEETISNVLTGETDIAKMSHDDFVEMLKCLGRMYFSRVMNCVDGTGKSDKEWTALSCIFSRVVEAITEKPSGNVAPPHEALSAALEQVNKVYDILSRPCVVIEEARQGCREARGVLIPALAAPPRNCDVGTPEEQDRRFDAFCKSYKEHHGNCFGCAALRTSGDCKVSWMRMPCEERGSE